MLTMNAKDTVSAALAECFVTIGEKRYSFMQAINLEAKFEREKSTVPILGRTGRGNKSTGWKGTGKAAFHYNTSIFRELMYRYKSTGEDVYFDIQVTNDDPTSSAGRQTVILKDCNIDGGVLARFDAVLGLKRLKAIHLNDSKNPFASHKDRHEKIGQGSIGLETLARIVRHPLLRHLPFYLETPNELDGYAAEIALLREAAAS